MFVLTWHQSLYPGVEEVGVKFLLSGCSGLFHVGVCCASLNDHMILTGFKIIGNQWATNANLPCVWLRRYC